MTEHDWLTGDDPGRMVGWLTGRRLITPRKLRLFACGASRLLAGSMDPRGLRAVETGERYADGEATNAQRLRRLAEAGQARVERLPRGGMAANEHGPWLVAMLASLTCQEDADLARHLASPSFFRLWPALGPKAAASLLRDVVGNPFRPLAYPCCEGARRVEAVPGDAATLTGGVCPTHGVTYHLKRWLTPAVKAVAGAVYAERRWEDLPVLADALEEAGCVGEKCEECGGRGEKDVKNFNLSWETIDCPACGGDGCIPNPMLAHLRGPGPHTRGCHALDYCLKGGLL